MATNSGNAPARRNEEESGGIFNTIMRSAAIFAVVQLGSRFIAGYNKPAEPAVPTFTDTTSPAAASAAAAAGESAAQYSYSHIPQQVAPMWPSNVSLDLKIFVSSSLAMPPLHRAPSSSLIVDEQDFGLGNWSENRVIETTFPVPRESANDGTLWAHMYIALHGHELDPASGGYDLTRAYYFQKPLNQVLPKRKEVKTKKLLGGDEEKDEDKAEAVENVANGGSAARSPMASYYHPNFTLSFIPDSATLAYPRLHPAVRSFVVLEPTGQRDTTGQNGWYYPVLFMNTFWQLRDHMRELNHTVTELPIRIELNNMANWKFSLFASVDDNSKANARNVANGEQIGMAGDGSEFEEFKRILIDSNPYLLATTFVVSIFHMVFEMLAFKNDVSHWRNKKDNVGVSFRSILANVVMQSIIFLYLMDNNEHTSWMILLSQGMGIAVEAWKITKTVDIKLRPAAAGSMLPYTVVFEDKHQLSETEKKTQEYDEIAFRYLYIVAVPLLLAYAVYSVMYESHKSWYSFVITTLVGSVYAYGFLMMVPSLYINYRLQSVAHMPGKAMTYKFLNTFIDDLFAFTIKMPTLHRLATLRDDVIFFIYLYQCWIYKIDFSRVNEFGQGGDDEELEDKKAAKPLQAAPDADTKAGTAATASGADVGKAKKIR